ncbi:E3 ubiquitin-protein ligase ariadne-1-like isoform X2 [Phymastichus coffea]|uniref:E3 ubiquitin-protein ligase ariadne-1-like isoform X2 n=1 Tax=Phymastichus coffea TaxID=108790 RepID=UPI00273B4989|nr:E3 ubiquitin-protein ligase ariadne-1-like isoform X2 [Phymastichus coffea]
MSAARNEQTEQDRNNEANNFMHEQDGIILDNNIESYYTTLLSMFPYVDSRYIRELCEHASFDSNEDNKLQMFVDHLIHGDVKLSSEAIDNDNEAKSSDKILTEILQLDEIEICEIKKQNERLNNDLLTYEFIKQDQEAVDQKINILENILPDANPKFLRDFIINNHENDRSMEEFIESSLTKRNYEKRDKYYANMKANEKIVQYITGFKVDEFVKQFPEPFEYFENIERQGRFKEQAFIFLRKRYLNNSEQYLSNVYSETNYNLSLADKQIQLETDYKKSEEEKEFEMLRTKNLLLECQCCFNELKPTECIECDNNHIFCIRCVNKGTNLAISKGHTSVQCFFGCDREISLNVLRKVLSSSTFDILLKKRQEAEIIAAHLEDLVTCPFCSYQMELAPQIKIFTCKNVECMKITCRLCRKINHLPIRCEDVLDEHKGRLYIEEEMSKALIRICHRCQKPFVKSVGCNTMTCICGAQMCYICRQPFTVEYSHTNCKINSDVFDQEHVEVNRTKAISKLCNDFPDIDIPNV